MDAPLEALLISGAAAFAIYVAGRLRRRLFAGTGAASPTARPARALARRAHAGAPNPVHYVFAHRALPQVVHHDAPGAFEILSGPEAPNMLGALWGEVAQRTGATAPEGLPRASVARIADRSIVLIHMPPPAAPPEAHFLAIVVEGDAGRVFTLERGADLGEGPGAVVGEWGKDGAHFNYGTVGTPTLEDFLGKVQDLLREAP